MPGSRLHGTSHSVYLFVFLCIANIVGSVLFKTYFSFLFAKVGLDGFLRHRIKSVDFRQHLLISLLSTTNFGRLALGQIQFLYSLIRQLFRPDFHIQNTHRFHLLLVVRRFDELKKLSFHSDIQIVRNVGVISQSISAPVSHKKGLIYSSPMKGLLSGSNSFFCSVYNTHIVLQLPEGGDSGDEKGLPPLNFARNMTGPVLACRLRKYSTALSLINSKFAFCVFKIKVDPVFCMYFYTFLLKIVVIFHSHSNEF